MSDTLLMLRLEHENISHVLDVLEDQIQRLKSHAPIDVSLLRLSIGYLMGFPEECHHPKEDLVYRALLEREPQRANALPNLGAEHELLATFTERIESETRGEIIDERALADLLREYVDTYRDHIATEEKYFFPAALESLTRDDLAALDFQLFDRKDRLFDKVAEARFAKLRDEITTRAGAEGGDSSLTAARVPIGEIELLRGLGSIEGFNKLMNRCGFRLSAYRSGGYALKRDGQWLLDIFECDEARAAWCAYYYLKGAESRRTRS